MNSLDNMNFYALDSNFNAISIVDGYESIIWTEKYNEVGDFEIFGPISAQLLSLLNTSTYIFNTLTKTLGVIEKPKSTYDEEEGSTLTLTGKSFSSILNRRTMQRTFTILDSVNEIKVAQILCDLVTSEFALSDSQSDRYVANLEVLDTTESDSAKLTAGTALLFEIGSSLEEHILELSAVGGLGFKFEFDITTSTITFVVYEGEDRASAGVERVLFSDFNDNLLTSSDELDFSFEKNAILVSGNYVDANDIPLLAQTITIGSPKGLNRRETYIQTDVAKTTEDESGTIITLSDAQYTALLQKAGAIELSQPAYKVYRNYEGEIIETPGCLYGVNFMLGDMVGFGAPDAIAAVARLAGVTFCDDANEGKTVAPIFEYI